MKRNGWRYFLAFSALTWAWVETTIAAGAAEPRLLQSAGVNQPTDMDAWRQQALTPKDLRPYLKAPPGTPNPAGGIYLLGGGGRTSFAGPDLDMPFAQWLRSQSAQRPRVDEAARQVLLSRFDLTCRNRPGLVMSGGKPQPLGPTARLPQGVDSWERYAALGPSGIRAGEAFPFKPLEHPLQSTAHMVFPPSWTRTHPEHERFDVGLDIPECFLPENPAPLYLTTHPELGDITHGVEITYANYFNMFNGVVTPEQLEGLRLLVTPFQTTWFNTTEHRVTAQPSAGVTCFSCHVNGHTNGAIALAPDSRPNYARLRTDAPSMRGNYAMLILSSKRSIRTLDHFAEVEEYFDGDTAMLAAIGGRTLQKSQTNHMGDFAAIIDFPPAPKLDVLNRLIPGVATAAELRGEKLFTGKAQCSVCHIPAQ